MCSAYLGIVLYVKSLPITNRLSHSLAPDITGVMPWGVYGAHWGSAYLRQHSSTTGMGSTLWQRYGRSMRGQGGHPFCVCAAFTQTSRLWNSLPIINLDLPFPVIKKKLVEYLWSCFMSKFESSNPCLFRFVYACNRCTALTKPLVLSQL